MSEILSAFSRFLRSPAFKFFFIGLLVLLLLIPLLSVWALVDERERRSQDVEREIGRLWGASQTMYGPFLVVPYTVKVVTRQGKEDVVEYVERQAVFTPETLDITSEVKSQIRTRGIYDVPVYSSVFQISGEFASPDIKSIESQTHEVRWRDAVIALSLTDVSGLKAATELRVEGAGAAKFEPSIGLPNDTTIGIHVPIRKLEGVLQAPQIATPPDQTAPADPQAPPRAFKFSFPIKLAGSLELNIAPVASNTRVSIKSDWPHPSFSGAFLPDERTVDNGGFTARWQVPDLARSVPKSWVRATSGSTTPRGYDRTRASVAGVSHSSLVNNLKPYVFGVRFFEPVDFYNLVERALKYGVLFLAVTFSAVFVLELLAGKRFHPVQYIMVGIALVFFFVLLLSFAEHVGFLPSYIIAATATGAMLSMYVARALDSASSGMTMLCLFTALYALLYVILTLEDYALLVGATAGFVMLAGVMFLTLRVDWSGGSSHASRAASASPAE